MNPTLPTKINQRFPRPFHGTDSMRVILLAFVMLLPACGQMGPLYLPDEPDPALQIPEPQPEIEGPVLEEPEQPLEDGEIESEDDTFDAGPEAL
jgi:predicted small lipoprotein YifL